MKTFFKSDRFFSIFDVSVSHGRVLFRSQKGLKYSHNLDIVFFGMTYIQVVEKLNGISLCLSKSKNIMIYESVNKLLEVDTNNLYEIQTGSEIFYIVANFVRVFENDLEFHETSLNFDNIGRGREIPLEIS